MAGRFRKWLGGLFRRRGRPGPINLRREGRGRLREVEPDPLQQELRRQQAEQHAEQFSFDERETRRRSRRPPNRTAEEERQERWRLLGKYDAQVRVMEKAPQNVGGRVDVYRRLMNLSFREAVQCETALVLRSAGDSVPSIPEAEEIAEKRLRGFRSAFRSRFRG